MIIDTIYAGDSTKIDEKSSVFLAGPSPGDVEMLGSWRRQLKDRLEGLKHEQVSKLQLIIPEPESGLWSDVINADYTERDQTLWEYESMLNSRIIAFWLPTYWSPEKAGPYPPNIGPSTRFEFGFFLHEALKNPRKALVVGSPENAESLTWARVLCDKYGMQWHQPDPSKNWELIPASFVENILAEIVNLSRL